MRKRKSCQENKKRENIYEGTKFTKKILSQILLLRPFVLKTGTNGAVSSSIAE